MSAIHGMEGEDLLNLKPHPSSSEGMGRGQDRKGGRRLEISRNDGQSSALRNASVHEGGGRSRKSVPEPSHSSTSSASVIEKPVLQSSSSDEVSSGSKSGRKSIPEPTLPLTVSINCGLNKVLDPEPLQGHSDNNVGGDTQNIEVGGKVDDNEDPLGGLNVCSRKNPTSLVEACSIPMSTSSGTEGCHNVELDAMLCDVSPGQCGNVGNAQGGVAPGDHTPQDVVAKQQRSGSSTGILKHVSQFDTPCSARQGAGRRVKFASQDDYRVVEGKGQRSTPKQGMRVCNRNYHCRDVHYRGDVILLSSELI